MVMTLRRTARLLPLLLACLAAGAGVRVPHPLPFEYDLYTFRGDARNTTVLGVFSVAAGELQAEWLERGVRYRFDVSVVLADTVHRTVVRADDSVFVTFRGVPTAAHLLYTQVELAAPPTATAVHRVIVTDATTPGIGQLYGGPFRIPAYRQEGIELSDVVLGLHDVRGGWTRGGSALAPLPTSRMPASAFEVYYEIYDLAAGAAYTTDIALEPSDQHAPRRAATPPVHLRFTDTAPADAGDILPQHRRVETSLPRGCWRMTVTVTDERTGQRAARTRHFDVRGWGHGTTLVRALPRGERLRTGGR